MTGTKPMHQKIALVDDDQNILTSVSMALQAEGYNVDTYPEAMKASDASLRRFAKF